MSYHDESDNIEEKKISYLRFSLHEEHFAVPLLSVKEVIAMPEVTSVPNTPKYFMGIMNLRGQIISIFDLRTKLNIKNEYNHETTVIICEMKPYCVGIVVNSVDSVLNLKASEIKDKPEIKSQHSTEYITGVVNIANEIILLVDLLKALDMSDREIMAQVDQKAS